uniref:Putative UDP-N-acetylglucosamine 2-epimerase n=1 Tax=viral metagenome TaxID=1070528 RepID=A0A6H1ZML5_9ZZZZ
MRCLIVVGARPNYIKAAPLIRTMQKDGSFDIVLVNTGQHYDANMSTNFLKELGMPSPQYNLGIGNNASWTKQLHESMVGINYICQDRKTDCVVVFGDVTSSLGATLGALSAKVPVAHVEAGLRSYDNSIEDTHRVLIDSASSWLFTPCKYSTANAERTSGIFKDRKICFVGNIMAESLLRFWPNVHSCKNIKTDEPYVLVTLHRQQTIDNVEYLKEILFLLDNLACKHKIRFVLLKHPRLQKNMDNNGITEKTYSHIEFYPPVSYFEMLYLENRARCIITDSGGVQVEASILERQCLTLRKTTEWQITVDCKLNKLVTTNTLSDAMLEIFKKPKLEFILLKDFMAKTTPPKWDLDVSQKIVRCLKGI